MRKTLACLLLAGLGLAAAAPLAAQPDAVDSLRQASLRKQRLATPRQTLQNFLEWQNPPGIDYAIAAEAFTLDPTRNAAKQQTLARQLKRVLDGRALLVRLESIPDSANHRDPRSGQAEYTLFPDKLPQVYLIKVGDEWLFAPETLQEIPRLYRQTYSAWLEEVQRLLPAPFFYSFLGIAIWQAAGFVLLLFTGIFLRRIFAWLINRLAGRLIAREQWQWEPAQLRSLLRPLSFLLMIGFFSLTYSNLQLPLRANLFLSVMLQLLAAAAIIWQIFNLIDAFSTYLARITRKTASKLDDQLIPILSKVLKLLALLLGVITVIQSYGYSIGSIVAGLGLGGLAIALAAQNTLANFFGSVMIFLDKPFQVGDFIRIDGAEGTVEEVGFRSTRLRTPENSVVTMPNAKLADVQIDNLGLRNYRRIRLLLGLTYSTTPLQMQAFVEGIRAIIAANPCMRKDAYEVYFNEFGAHSLNVLVVCFLKVGSISEELREKHNFFMEILRLAAAVGVEFAFPTQTLHIDSFYARQPRVVGKQLSEAELAKIVQGFGPGGEYSQPSAPRLQDNGIPVDFTAQTLLNLPKPQTLSDEEWS
ncbi:MAG: mechanosensitive ion channel family protein [candidate division KSB1 bacterium]|nr:mechanosensitive ion channel family protein [candidate division KSB1 bacterium]MDZ7273384.1 mechanosensitive ion channel family protein [candidate division KSB1 bacterium]MDZ7288046.1 mechanosensitive ion channel family protein [candidate division KSB1 bacterium]MDZ7300102.1 mechanosensitive ion channel family protein [candidate division KSB1 bacterium]MDZ7307226.1 mechanosensitive ion channel family protein [candidate division KSB1 bacterium]